MQRIQGMKINKTYKKFEDFSQKSGEDQKKGLHGLSLRVLRPRWKPNLVITKKFTPQEVPSRTPN